MIRTFSIGLAASACLLAEGDPLAAREGDEWSSISGKGRCDLRYGTGENIVFALSFREDGSYALDGEAFTRADGEGLVGGEIRVLGEAGDFLLNGDQEAMDEQRERLRDHPVSLFLAANEGGDSFTLVTEAGLKPVPLAGFAEPAAAFRACSRAMMLGPGPRPPVPIAFDGLQQLAAAAQRQRLLSEVIGYTLTVDEKGKATQCELSRTFRRKIVKIQLCRPLLEHYRFEPARDENGDPVPGRYSSRIDFDMWMTQDGYLEAEDR